MGNDDRMKKARMVFYEDDIASINEVLEGFISASQATCCLLIDKEGHLVTQRGHVKSIDTTSIAALVAGSFASTKQVASMLGETEFSVLFHQGQNENIHVSLVGERALLVIIFDDRTTIGMVRVYAEDVSGKLSTIFNEAEEKHAGDDPQMSKEYNDSAQQKIEDFFSEE